MSVLFSIIIYSVLVVCENQAARILAVFPVPSISHQVVFRPLTQALAKQGHEVVIITPDPAFPKGNTPVNITEIDVHDISYEIWREQFMTANGAGDKNNLLAQLQAYLDAIVLIVDHQLRNKEVQELINDKERKFDLLLLEAVVHSAIIFSHIYKVPVIQVSSFGSTPGNYEYMGAPIQPILFPTVLNQKLYNLTMWEKVRILYNYYQIDRMYERHDENVNKMLSEHFGPHTPKVQELMNNVHMLFLNINPIFEGNRPVPPGVVYMGGLPQKPDKKLPEDLKTYLDSSKNGVIYISFGTNVDSTTLSKEKIQTFIKVFSQLPYNVLWKWDNEELTGRSENIRISKWLPQSDLLKHPNVKLFITQGGTQSTDEAITAGVPLIGIPMIGDQWYNVEKYVFFKIGIRLDLNSIEEENFRNAIDTVIGDDSYRRNIVKLRDLMNDQPQTPLERAVWWTEYVLRHGGAKQLQAPSSNISLSEFLELKLVFTLLAIIVAAALSCLLVLYALAKFISVKLSGIKKLKVT